MSEAGVPQSVAVTITGHLTDSMFPRYAIVDGEQKRNAPQKTQEQLTTFKSRKVVGWEQSEHGQFTDNQPFADNEHDVTD